MIFETGPQGNNECKIHPGKCVVLVFYSEFRRNKGLRDGIAILPIAYFGLNQLTF